jgi:RNA polymerase sigma factor (sigma-70 family)
MTGKAIDPDKENQVWSRFCKGDRDAFDSIYATYFSQLFQYCLRFTADRELIGDIMQDFFIELFCKPPRNTTVTHLKSYLFVSVRRRLLKTINKQVKMFESLTDEDSYDFHLELSADNALIAINRAQAIQGIVNKLTTRQREAVYLYFFEEISYVEIAEIMSLKEVKYARTLIYRALDDLRGILSRNTSLSEFIRN